MEKSVIHGRLGPRQVRALAMDAKDVANYQQLSRIGIYLKNVGQMARAFAMDGNDVGINPSPMTMFKTLTYAVMGKGQ